MSRYSGWDDAAVRQALNKPPRAKYGSKKVCLDGVWFDSKAEGAHYVRYKSMQAAGLIKDLKCQPVFPVGINGIYVCTVVLDFEYLDLKTGTRVYVDIKGKDNPLSKLKRKMVEAEYGIKVEIIR